MLNFLLPLYESSSFAPFMVDAATSPDVDITSSKKPVNIEKILAIKLSKSLLYLIFS